MLNKEHQILIIAKNTNGIVARIMSLFNRRGYFVKKMSAGVTNKEGYARLTLTVDGDKESLDQIQKQVYKIIDVVKVKIFPDLKSFKLLISTVETSLMFLQNHL